MWTNETKPHMGRRSTLCLSHAKNGIQFRSAYTQPNCRHSWREGRWQFVRLSGHSSRKEASDFPVQASGRSMRKCLKCVTICVRATMPQSGKRLGCGMNGRGIVVIALEGTRHFTFCQLPDIWPPLRLQSNCYLELFCQKWPHRNVSQTLLISVEVKNWWKYTSITLYNVIAL